MLNDECESIAECLGGMYWVPLRALRISWRLAAQGTNGGAGCCWCVCHARTCIGDLCGTLEQHWHNAADVWLDGASQQPKQLLTTGEEGKVQSFVG